jgi:TonB family protein
MNSFANYLIEANAALIVMLGLYHLLLRNETNFTVVRVIMLAGGLLSTVLPLVHLENFSSVALPVRLPTYWLPEIQTTSGAGGGSTTVFANLWRFAIALYLAGIAIAVIKLFHEVIQIFALINTGRSTKIQKVVVVESDEMPVTFSFFNVIFIGGSENLSASEKNQIIEHESVHARQWHSLDIVFMNVISILFWFNPLIRSYKKIFVQLHEFEADARAVENQDVNRYCNLLARVALQSAGFNLASHFNNSLTTKRIQMMRTVKREIQWWKLGACAMIFCTVFIFVACEDQLGSEKNSSVKAPVEVTKEASGDVYIVVEEQPEYKGGYEAMVEYIQNNLVYPKTARMKGVEGTTFVQFTVNEDGAISDVLALRGIDAECDGAAIRLVESMPNWNPGKVSGENVKTRFVLPIKFKLQ